MMRHACRALRHMTRAINNVDAARIWKRWRGFRAAAAVVCGSDAGSITSCSCCAHVLCSRLLRLQQQPSHAALSHGAWCGRCRQLHAQLLPVDERFNGATRVSHGATGRGAARQQVGTRDCASLALGLVTRWCSYQQYQSTTAL